MLHKSRNPFIKPGKFCIKRVNMIVRQLENEWALLLTYPWISHNPATTRGIVFTHGGQVLAILLQNSKLLDGSQQAKPVELHSKQVLIIRVVLAAIKHEDKEALSTTLSNAIGFAGLPSFSLRGRSVSHINLGGEKTLLL